MNSITLSDVFTGPAETEGKKETWENFRNKVAAEFKGIKWTGALSDLTPRISELFDIQLPGLFVSAWKKTDGILKALKESEPPSGRTFYIDLAEHKINSSFSPYIELHINGIPAPKKLNFKLDAEFVLKGFILKIENGVIAEIRTGTCSVTGILKYEDIVLVKKEITPINLPGKLTI